MPKKNFTRDFLNVPLLTLSELERQIESDYEQYEAFQSENPESTDNDDGIFSSPYLGMRTDEQRRDIALKIVVRTLMIDPKKDCFKYNDFLRFLIDDGIADKSRMHLLNSEREAREAAHFEEREREHFYKIDEDLSAFLAKTLGDQLSAPEGVPVLSERNVFVGYQGSCLLEMGDEPTLYEVSMRSHDANGYFCLGTTREQYVKVLSDASNNLDIRHLLAEEMFEMQPPCITSKTSLFLKYNMAFKLLESLCQHYSEDDHKSFEEKIRRVESLVRSTHQRNYIRINEFIAAKQEFFETRDCLMEYLTTKKVYLDYLNGHIKYFLNLGVIGAKAFSVLSNLNLHIWKKGQRRNILNRDKALSHISREAVDDCHVFLKYDNAHYDRLFVEKALAEAFVETHAETFYPSPVVNVPFNLEKTRDYILSTIQEYRERFSSQATWSLFLVQLFSPNHNFDDLTRAELLEACRSRFLVNFDLRWPASLDKMKSSTLWDLKIETREDLQRFVEKLEEQANRSRCAKQVVRRKIEKALEPNGDQMNELHTRRRASREGVAKSLFARRKAEYPIVKIPMFLQDGSCGFNWSNFSSVKELLKYAGKVSPDAVDPCSGHSLVFIASVVGNKDFYNFLSGERDAKRAEPHTGKHYSLAILEKINRQQDRDKLDPHEKETLPYLNADVLLFEMQKYLGAYYEEWSYANNLWDITQNSDTFLSKVQVSMYEKWGAGTENFKERGVACRHYMGLINNALVSYPTSFADQVREYATKCQRTDNTALHKKMQSYALKILTQYSKDSGFSSSHFLANAGELCVAKLQDENRELKEKLRLAEKEINFYKEQLARQKSLFEMERRRFHDSHAASSFFSDGDELESESLASRTEPSDVKVSRSREMSSLELALKATQANLERAYLELDACRNKLQREKDKTKRHKAKAEQYAPYFFRAQVGSVPEELKSQESLTLNLV